MAIMLYSLILASLLVCANPAEAETGAQVVAKVGANIELSG